MAYPVPNKTDMVIGVAVQSLATAAEVASVVVGVPYLSRRTKRKAENFIVKFIESRSDEVQTEVLRDPQRLEVHLYYELRQRISGYESVYQARKAFRSAILDLDEARPVLEKRHLPAAVAVIDAVRLATLAQIQLCERQLTKLHASATL